MKKWLVVPVLCLILLLVACTALDQGVSVPSSSTSGLSLLATSTPTSPMSSPTSTSVSITSAPTSTSAPVTSFPSIRPTAAQHEHIYQKNVVAPTCMEIGYTLYLCACGDNYMGEEVAALGHTWKDATCTDPKTCERCGTTEGTAIEHEWRAATCTTPKTCCHCGVKDGDVEHTYVDGKCQICKALKPSDGLRYTWDEDNECYSVSRGSCTDADIVIPSMYNGYPVKQIDRFLKCNELKTIIIPDTVEYIGMSAFTSCKNLEYVYFGENSRLKVIEEGAFGHCTSLKEIFIPASVVKIGGESDAEREVSGAFAGCTSLKKVLFAEDSNLEMLGDRTFEYCSSLSGTVVLPDGLTVLGSTAFADTGIESIEFGSALKTIPWYVLSSCPNLISVVIKSSVEEIKHGAFSGCRELETIYFLGDVAQWNAIEKGPDWNYGVFGVWIICNDGEMLLG